MSICDSPSTLVAPRTCDCPRASTSLSGTARSQQRFTGPNSITHAMEMTDFLAHCPAPRSLVRVPTERRLTQHLTVSRSLAWALALILAGFSLHGDRQKRGLDPQWSRRPSVLQHRTSILWLGEYAPPGLPRALHSENERLDTDLKLVASTPSGLEQTGIHP